MSSALITDCDLSGDATRARSRRSVREWMLRAGAAPSTDWDDLCGRVQGSHVMPAQPSAIAPAWRNFAQPGPEWVIDQHQEGCACWAHRNLR